MWFEISWEFKNDEWSVGGVFDKNYKYTENIKYECMCFVKWTFHMVARINSKEKSWEALIVESRQANRFFGQIRAAPSNPTKHTASPSLAWSNHLFKKWLELIS